MSGGSEPCDALQAELALDLLEGELAAELPAHMRAFARAHADGRPPPAAPLLARLASTLTTARNACMHDLLADRGLALLRLVAPLVIEDDPAVVAARAQPPSWPGLATLAAARDAASRVRFGCGAIELLHKLHGVDAASQRESKDDVGAPGPAIEGWQSPATTPSVDHAAILDAWQAIAARAGVTGNVRIDRSPRAQPRAFVVDPKAELIIVVPEQLATPAARFSVLHELGHAVAALALEAGVPRVVDEAAASYIARLAEPPSFLPPRWTTELAPRARRRRLAIAVMFDEVERALPAINDVPAAPPPWALWNDPGAQAAYVEAEAIADRLAQDLGPNPPRGQLVRALQAERDRVDQRTRL